MTSKHSPSTVVEFLEGIAHELAEIHRGSDYSLWRSEAKHRVENYLSEAEPFSAFTNAWVFSGDGAGAIVGGRFGEWAIDRLVEKTSPADIILRFEQEVARNSAVYEDVSPILGIEITEERQLAPGIRLVPPSDNIFEAFGYTYRLAWPRMPTGTGFLIQRYSVSPAFERRSAEATGPIGANMTVPASAQRDAIRNRFRLAGLLGTAGGVELPMSAILADRDALLAVGGMMSGRAFGVHPLTAFPADLDAITEAFEQIAAFQEGDSLSRAIDRLGRSRLAVNPVDRALDLGMAAEIVLMHDQGTSNTEITHKIASRAAWLLSSDVDERCEIFDQVKQLYSARSTAVHSGVLSSKSKVDLDAADALVSRVVSAILRRGSFPDWINLTMGGG